MIVVEGHNSSFTSITGLSLLHTYTTHTTHTICLHLVQFRVVSRADAHGFGQKRSRRCENMHTQKDLTPSLKPGFLILWVLYKGATAGNPSQIPPRVKLYDCNVCALNHLIFSGSSPPKNCLNYNRTARGTTDSCCAFSLTSC